MGLADDWRRLVAALTGRPDTAEEARLAALFQNRSELKKELNALDDERHRLLDRLKLQEGSTMRVEEQLANLEQYLGRPEEGQKCVAYFQLRAVWRSASRRLEQFATELTRQQKDRERRQQLTEFERNKRNRLDDAGPRDLRGADPRRPARGGAGGATANGSRPWADSGTTSAGGSSSRQSRSGKRASRSRAPRSRISATSAMRSNPRRRRRSKAPASRAVARSTWR